MRAFEESESSKHRAVHFAAAERVEVEDVVVDITEVTHMRLIP